VKVHVLGYRVKFPKYYYYIAEPVFLYSYAELDRVKIAVKGVERCKEENCDLIIVDASGGYKQKDTLFEEMHQVSKATVFIIYAIYAFDTRSCYIGYRWQ